MGGRWSQLFVVTCTAVGSGVYIFDPLVRGYVKLTLSLTTKCLPEEQTPQGTRIGKTRG